MRRDSLPPHQNASTPRDMAKVVAPSGLVVGRKVGRVSAALGVGEMKVGAGDTAMKTCTKCGEAKPASDFRYGRCRECVKKQNALYRKEHAERIKEQNALYRQKNADRIAETISSKKENYNANRRKKYLLVPEWRAKLADSRRRQYWSNVEKARANTKRWAATHQEKVRAYRMNYCASERLVDSYVASTIIQKTRGLRTRDVASIIPLQRAKIQIRRATKLLLKTIKEKTNGR